jgi:hypothetical protein
VEEERFFYAIKLEALHRWIAVFLVTEKELCALC